MRQRLKVFFAKGLEELFLGRLPGAELFMGSGYLFFAREALLGLGFHADGEQGRLDNHLCLPSALRIERPVFAVSVVLLSELASNWVEGVHHDRVHQLALNQLLVVAQLR